MFGFRMVTVGILFCRLLNASEVFGVVYFPLALRNPLFPIGTAVAVWWRLEGSETCESASAAFPGLRGLCALVSTPAIGFSPQMTGSPILSHREKFNFAESVPAEEIPIYNQLVKDLFAVL